MAKKTIVLTYDQMTTYRRRSYEGDISYIEYTERAEVATTGITRGTDSRRVWCDFKPLWDAAVTASNVRSVEMAVGLIAGRNNTGKMTVKFVAWNGFSIGVDREDIIYDQCVSGDTIGTVEIGAGGSASKTLTLSGDALADFLAYKGIGIAAQTEAEEGDGTQLTAEVNSISVVIEYANEGATPVISIDSISQAASKVPLYSYTDSITFGWSYSQEAGLSQSKIDVQIRSDAGGWITLADGYTTSAQSYTISPQNFPAPYAKGGVMRVRVRAYSSSGIASEWAEVRLAMVFPETYQLSPGGGSVVMADSAAVLSWAVRTEYDGVVLNDATDPDTFDIAYSTNGGEEWTDIKTGYQPTVSGGLFTYNQSTSSFPAGVVLWRVRPVVNGYRLENWVQESIVIRVQAETSYVGCDGQAMPMVYWDSSSQIAYRVRFADYDSGIIAGTETRHTVPYVYDNGVYPVQVRTQAADGTWNEWTAVQYVTVKNGGVAGIKPILAAKKTENAVSLSWAAAGHDGYILYRNGIPIYAGSEKKYTDIGAFGTCQYYVRGMIGNDYSQSTTVSVDATPRSDCMYDMTDEKWIPLVYSSAERTRSYSETAAAVYKHYAGRQYPVAFTDGSRERQLNVSYCFKTIEDADAVRAALGHIVIYKDTMGRRIVGLFTGMSETVTRRFEYQMTIVQVDYKEDVPYET